MGPENRFEGHEAAPLNQRSDDPQRVPLAPKSELEEQAELERKLVATLTEIMSDKPEVNISNIGFLYRQLARYLSEYPFLASDKDALLQIREAFRERVPFPQGSFASGVYDAGYDFVEEYRDKQIRSILDYSSPDQAPQETGT